MNSFVQPSQKHQTRSKVDIHAYRPKGLTTSAVSMARHSKEIEQQLLQHSLSESPEAQSLTQLQQTLNQSPRVLAQAKMIENLQMRSMAVHEPNIDTLSDASRVRPYIETVSEHTNRQENSAQPVQLKDVSSSAPIQRFGWQDMLAVTGIVGGATSLATGAKLGSRLLAVGGGLAMLAGGAYTGYKAWDAHRRNQMVANARRDVFNFQPEDNARGVLLNKIINELRPYDRNMTSYATTRGGSGTTHPGGPRSERRYRIDVNPDSPQGDPWGADPDILKSTILHELTHIAVDQAYDINANRAGVRGPENFVIGDQDVNEARLEQDDALLDQYDDLRATIRNDNLIPTQEHQYISSHVQRMSDIPHEFDTVVNDLLYYSALKGIPVKSPTVKKLMKLAQERYTLRNSG